MVQSTATLKKYLVTSKSERSEPLQVRKARSTINNSGQYVRDLGYHSSCCWMMALFGMLWSHFNYHFPKQHMDKI